MRLTILSDNIPGDGLGSEWGLSIFIEYNGTSILMDTGASPLFIENAKKLGIDISKVRYAVLSHAHYDHADGMDAFFSENSISPFFLRTCSENCWAENEKGISYIGIKKGTLQKHASRIKFVDGDKELIPGVWLIPHKIGNFTEIGKKAKMFTEVGNVMLPDTFSHEHSLVLDTNDGLVIISPCSHSGADNIINEIAMTFPAKKIRAVIGGFHLFRSTDDEVLQFAANLRKTGVRSIVTGHCTGDTAFGILKSELGDVVTQMHSGLSLEY